MLELFGFIEHGDVKTPWWYNVSRLQGANDSTALQQTKINDIYIAVWISRVVPLARWIIAKRMSIHHAAKQFLKNEGCLISQPTVSMNPLQGWQIFIHLGVASIIGSSVTPELCSCTLTAPALWCSGTRIWPVALSGHSDCLGLDLLIAASGILRLLFHLGG